jgi:hypothetical protein
VVEAGKVVDFPIPGVIGREFDVPISLGLLSDNPELKIQHQATIRVSVKDDIGQEGKTETVVKWK